VAKWRAIIRRERGAGDALVREALKWRESIAMEKDEDRTQKVGRNLLTLALTPETALPSGGAFHFWSGADAN
jgi:hypothetical protein